MRSADSDDPIEVENARPANQFTIVKLVDIDDRDQARELTNAEVFLEREFFPEVDPEEVYQKDLEGSEVAILEADDGSTRVIGEVAGFFETGANDVMVVQLEDDQRLLVPVIESAIAALDAEGVLLHPLEQWAPAGTDLP